MDEADVDVEWIVREEGKNSTAGGQRTGVKDHELRHRSWIPAAEIV